MTTPNDPGEPGEKSASGDRPPTGDQESPSLPEPGEAPGTGWATPAASPAWEPPESDTSGNTPFGVGAGTPSDEASGSGGTPAPGQEPYGAGASGQPPSGSGDSPFGAGAAAPGSGTPGGADLGKAPYGASGATPPGSGTPGSTPYGGDPSQTPYGSGPPGATPPGSGTPGDTPYGADPGQTPYGSGPPGTTPPGQSGWGQPESPAYGQSPYGSGPSAYPDQPDYPSGQQYPSDDQRSLSGQSYTPQQPGGYPSYPQQGYQPYDQGQPAKPTTQTFSIIGFVCAALALVICPIIFGPAGIILGLIGHSKGEPLGRWAAIAAGVAMLLGFVIGFAVLNTDIVPDQS